MTENMNFCEECSLHGIKYVKSSKTKIEKYFWVTTLCISLVLAVILTWNILQKRMHQPVIISFEETQEPIWNIAFPAVTICPETKSKPSVFDFTRVYQELERKNFTNVTQEELKYFKAVISLCDEWYINSHINKTKLHVKDVDLLREMAPTLEETLSYCTFRSVPDDCTDRFAEMITEDGVCFTFNAIDGKEIFKMAPDFPLYDIGKKSNWSLDSGYISDEYMNHPERGYVAGHKHGISVVLMQHQDEVDYLCRGPDQGYRVYLHNPAEHPRGTEDYVKVQFGSETTIKIVPEMTSTDDNLKSYKPEDRKCYYTNERSLRFFEIYTKSNCELECLTNYTVSKCGCIQFNMPRETGMNVCDIDQLYCYMEGKYENWDLATFVEGTAEFEKKNVTQDCNCLPTCTELTYETDVTQAAIDWSHFLKAFKQPFNRTENVRYAKLDVFFKVSKIVKVKRSELYSNTDLIANFGGLIGIFLGASLLSIVEIIYFCVTHIVSYTSGRTKNATNEPKSSSQGNVIGLQRYASQSRENFAENGGFDDKKE